MQGEGQASNGPGWVQFELESVDPLFGLVAVDPVGLVQLATGPLRNRETGLFPRGISAYRPERTQFPAAKAAVG